MTQRYLLTGLLLAGMAFVPAVSMSAATKECPVSRATPESYKWNFKNEASQLLDRVRTDALDARHHAATLESEAEDTDIDWRFDADQLNTIRHDINDMGNVLCRLETIRRVASPQEKHVIDRTFPLISSMAGNADAAIKNLNQNQLDFWQPVYKTYADNLYTDARKLSNAIGRFEAQANTRS